MSRSSFHSLAAALATLAAGCAGAGPARTGGTAHQVVLAARRGCCGPASPAAKRLRAALGRRARVQSGTLDPEAEGDHAGAARAATDKARKLFLTMKMEAASAALRHAEESVRACKARGLTPEDLGAIYLLWGAVSDAGGRQEDASRYYAAAVRFHPRIDPDPDTFPPTVRQAVDRARREQKLVNVSIQARPRGARVTWDGRPVGRSPVQIPQQAKGEHYLVVEHPLHATREETIYLSTNASLQVELEPADAPAIAAAIRQDPAVADEGLALLGARSVVWVEPSGEGGKALAVNVYTTQGGRRSYQLTGASTQLEIDRAAEAAVADGAPSTTKPARGASIWRRYWWAWALGGAAVLAAGIAIPVAATSGGESNGGRGVRLDLP